MPAPRKACTPSTGRTATQSKELISNLKTSVLAMTITGQAQKENSQTKEDRL
jgi:hypothetical protein